MTSLDEVQSRAPTAVIRDFLRRSISLADVARQVWSGRLIVVMALLLALLYGLYEAHRAGPQFTAAMSVMPSQTDTDSASMAGGAVSMLAGLTGGSVSAAQVPKFTQFLATLGSVGVADILDRKYDLLCVTFRNDCNVRTHQWRERTGMREWFNGVLARIGGLPDPNAARTAVDLAQYNFAAIEITKDKTNGLVILSFHNRDPKFAADYLSKVVHTTNDYIRDQDRTVQRTYVDYISKRVATSTNVNQREALDSILLQEERKLMMTEVDVPYAATILDGPDVTPLNSVLKTVLLDGLLGLLLGIAFTLFWHLVPPQFRFWSAIWPRS